MFKVSKCLQSFASRSLPGVTFVVDSGRKEPSRLSIYCFQIPFWFQQGLHNVLLTLASIWPLLTRNVTAKLVSSMIISRPDYCNSILAGLQAEQIARLQRVQKNAGRLLLWKKISLKREHVIPLLKELHWLPVKFRFQYKIATLAYRHFERSFPLYLSLCTYQPPLSLLRSSNEKVLKFHCYYYSVIIIIIFCPSSFSQCPLSFGFQIDYRRAHADCPNNVQFPFQVAQGF